MALNSHSTCRITVTAAGSEFEFPCGPGDPVLSAMERQGLELIPVGCRGGGCGACKIRVLSGNYRCGPMSAAQVSPADRARRIALACRCYPDSDLRLRVVGTLSGMTISSGWGKA